MQEQTLDYQDQGTTFKGFYACDETIGNPTQKPAILICHDWSGLNDFARNKAKQVADLGYLGFALDMYGEGQCGQTTEEKMALMKPLMENRAILRQRINAALNTLKALPQVDKTKIAAIGFCFGGLCVLDLARSGAELQAVISFHGLLNPADNLPNTEIKAKVLALLGYEDPMVPPELAKAFADEMTKAKVDWQMNTYGQTKHAFMNPLANDANLGLMYNPKVEHRAWQAMQDFLKEVFRIKALPAATD